MSKYFIKVAASKDEQEAAKELRVNQSEVFMLIASDGSVKLGTYADVEAPDWSDIMVSVRFPKRHAESLASELKMFAEKHHGVEVKVMAQANRSLHIFYKGIGDPYELAQIAKKYDW